MVWAASAITGVTVICFARIKPRHINAKLIGSAGRGIEEMPGALLYRLHV